MTKREIVKTIVDCFCWSGKLLICGNGGSAAMAQHMAAEFMGKFEMSRPPLPAIALTTDTSLLTCLPNDYPDGFKRIFSRQIQALAKKDDVLIVFSTSGKSKNCLAAIKEAHKWGVKVIDFPRRGATTAKVQEYQFRLMHDVCREVEKTIFA